MVLWELTLATAYWLGIRKTYRLALKLQRRLISPNHPRIREFVHRRTRNVFDVALSVHKKIQGRDLAAEKGVGNSILRMLDRARPSAKIRGPSICDKENALQKRLPAGSGAGDKSSTIMETKSSKSNMGPDKVLFSQYVSKGPFAQSLINRVGGGLGRCTGLSDTRSVLGYRPYTTAGTGLQKSQYTIPTTWHGASFEKGVFRTDIAQQMGVKGARRSAAF